MSDRCKCGAVSVNTCNDCDAGVCDSCTSADFRCSDCCGANGSASDLFDDPEADDFDPNDEDARYIREQQGLAVSDDEIAALPSLRTLV